MECAFNNFIVVNIDVMISKYYIEITVAAVKLLDISSVLE